MSLHTVNSCLELKTGSLSHQSKMEAIKKEHVSKSSSKKGKELQRNTAVQSTGAVTAGYLQQGWSPLHPKPSTGVGEGRGRSGGRE